MPSTVELCTLAVLLMTLSPLDAGSPSSGFDVTNEQLRGAMLTLVSSYNTLENNLERHELRERALGEVLKKGLQTLHKGQRIFEPMRGTFSRLDERISQMETLLIGRDTELKDQQTQTGAALSRIQQWMSERVVADVAAQLKSDQRFEQLLAAVEKPTPKILSKHIGGDDSSDDNDDDDDVGKKVDDLAESVKRLRQEVAEMMADRSNADESVKALIAQVDRLVGTKVATSEEVVAALEQKLENFYVTGQQTAAATFSPHEPTATALTPWEERVQTSLLSIETQMRSLQLPTLSRDFFDTLANETLEAITDMRIEVLTASDKSFAKTATRIKEATSTLDAAITEAVRTISETSSGSQIASLPTTAQPVSASTVDEQLHERVLKGYAELRGDIAGLRQLEKAVLETGDNVLSVKRAMEYNVYAITLGVGEQIATQAATIDETLREQFGQLNETIYANHNGALTNLTSKIETEISQVWRQIGIMFQMVQSTELSLNKLQEQTEIYVNGTSAVMDGMGGKVSQITERMAEVDSNLNYLLGRLSLVTQEFNQIKTGLGSALDNIKSSFQIVQRQIQNVGPGPHNIENETDYNVVKDQSALSLT